MKLEPDAREAEQANPNDHALAYVTLDGTEGPTCLDCHRVRCWYCDEARPCLCDEGGEISQRETRAMTERYDRGMRWRS